MRTTFKLTAESLGEYASPYAGVNGAEWASTEVNEGGTAGNSVPFVRDRSFFIFLTMLITKFI